MVLNKKQFERLLALHGTHNPPAFLNPAEAIAAATLIAAYQALEARLHERAAPPASPHLASRILAAAQQHPVSISLMAWLRDIFAEFRLPHPSYAVALMMFLGFGIGINTATTTANTTALQITLSETLTNDGNFL